MRTPYRRWQGQAAMGFTIIAVAAGAFFLARALSDRGRATAATVAGPVPTEQVPGPNVTPPPDSTPNTANPLWYVPYWNAETQKPRYDQVINGILIGPTVPTFDSGKCVPGQAVWASEQAIASSSLAINPAYLPAGAILDRKIGTACGGQLVSAEKDYVIPAAPGIDGQLRSGAVNYFDAQHGGAFQIFRDSLKAPSWQSKLASQRWFTTQINGYPAAEAHPIFDAGFGDSAIVVWQTGVQTVIIGQSISLADLTKIAERVVR